MAKAALHLRKVRRSEEILDCRLLATTCPRRAAKPALDRQKGGLIQGNGLAQIQRDGQTGHHWLLPGVALRKMGVSLIDTPRAATLRTGLLSLPEALGKTVIVVLDASAALSSVERPTEFPASPTAPP